MNELFPEPKDASFIVVNLRFYSGEYVYIGRPGRGKEGPLGNPYTREEHGDRAYELFETWFAKEVEDERSAYRLKLEEVLRGPLRVLGCFCKRKDGTGRCHGDPVAAWLNARLRLMRR